jgi:hypothetical protein
VNTPDAPTTNPGPASPVRWFQRVLPVTVLALLLIVLAGLLVPDFRSQLRLSLTRLPEPYVDLYFVEAPPGTLKGGQVTCARHQGKVVVDFVVRSHLTDTRSVAYAVKVIPTKHGQKTRRSTGALRLEPGQSDTVHESFALRRGSAYQVTVALPGRAERLRAHCGAGGGAST